MKGYAEKRGDTREPGPRPRDAGIRIRRYRRSQRHPGSLYSGRGKKRHQEASTPPIRQEASYVSNGQVSWVGGGTGGEWRMWIEAMGVRHIVHLLGHAGLDSLHIQHEQDSVYRRPSRQSEGRIFRIDTHQQH